MTHAVEARERQGETEPVEALETCVYIDRMLGGQRFRAGFCVQRRVDAAGAVRLVVQPSPSTEKRELDRDLDTTAFESLNGLLPAIEQAMDVQTVRTAAVDDAWPPPRR